MDGSRFWWTGMHKAKNSDSFVWNSTNQEQELVNSWEGGNPTELEIEAEGCVGISSLGSLRAEDCTAKHSAICQFGRQCSMYLFLYIWLPPGLSCEDGVPAPPEQCWCGSVHSVCKNDSMCVEGECVPRCHPVNLVQKVDCWCKDLGKGRKSK